VSRERPEGLTREKDVWYRDAANFVLMGADWRKNYFIAYLYSTSMGCEPEVYP